MPTIRSSIRNAVRNAIPASRRLGFDFRVARLARRLEPELLHLARIVDRGRTALDIGANQGFYSYALAGRFQRVLAFEPNSAIAEDLRRSALAKLEVHNVALSATNGVQELYVPTVDGVQQHGWASFDRFNLAEATDVLEVEVPVRTLDSYALEGVDFIKIDVEGHEPEVLAGALDTLERNRPVVLAEVREANLEGVLALFERLRYATHILRAGSLVPWHGAQPGDGENLVFKPTAAR
jgi:FkbM family methyltransferase